MECITHILPYTVRPQYSRGLCTVTPGEKAKYANNTLTLPPLSFHSHTQHHCHVSIPILVRTSPIPQTLNTNTLTLTLVIMWGWDTMLLCLRLVPSHIQHLCDVSVSNLARTSLITLHAHNTNTLTLTWVIGWGVRDTMLLGSQARPITHRTSVPY